MEGERERGGGGGDDSSESASGEVPPLPPIPAGLLPIRGPRAPPPELFRAWHACRKLRSPMQLPMQQQRMQDRLRQPPHLRPGLCPRVRQPPHLRP
eukprot:480243-Alexandrium_andersonii.AAC.1